MASKKTRNGALQVSIRRKGYRPIYKTFDDTDDGEAEADIWIASTELQIRLGKYAEQDRAIKTPLRDAMMRYYNEVTPTMKGSRVQGLRIKALCTIPLTDRPMNELNSMHIAMYRDEMLEDGKSPSTINNHLAIISRVYRIAATEWGIAVDNPCRNVRRPQQTGARDRRFEEGEEERLMLELHQPYKDMVILLLETAMRRGELFKLRWKDVNLRDRYVVLRDTKNGETRSVPLSTTARDVLARMPVNIKGEVFTSKPQSLTQAFRRLCKRLEIEDLRIHDLRHEATSRFFEKGVLSLMEIASITGHKDLKMLQRYTHFNASTLAEKLG